MAAMNNRITVRSQVNGQDTAGQPEVTWQDVATVWADIHFESGNAAIRGDQQITAVRASVKVWARSDFVAGMQVQQQGRGLKLHVSAVLPDERDRKFMYLVCEATR